MEGESNTFNLHSISYHSSVGKGNNAIFCFLPLIKKQEEGIQDFMDTLKREVLSERVRLVKPSGIRKFFDIINTMPDVISLGVGEPDFVTPAHIREAGIRSIQLGHTRYTSNYGILELREEIAALLQRRYGLNYDPRTEILVTVGVSEGVDLIAAAITPRTKMILIGNPNNPTGAVVPQDELEGIARLAIEHDLIVAIDEVYSRLVYEAEHISIAAMPGMRERTLLLDGFSKAYAMTGWRIGYVAVPAHILEAMLKIHQYTVMCAGTASQEAAIEALRNGENDVQIMHADYARRRRMFVDGLNRIGLPTCEPRGAFYAFPYIGDTGMTDEEFAEKLLFEEQVAVVPGSSFGAAGAGFVRCAYCTAYDKLEEALVRMERFLKNHQ